MPKDIEIQGALFFAKNGFSKADSDLIQRLTISIFCNTGKPGLGKPILGNNGIEGLGDGVKGRDCKNVGQTVSFRVFVSGVSGNVFFQALAKKLFLESLNDIFLT